jgi:hypothetical protein
MDPDMVGDGDIEITRQQNRNYCIAEGFRRIAKESNAIGLMLRYRAQAEREYRRAVEDFDRLKFLRAQMPNEPNVGVEPPEPEDIVPIRELNWELARYPQQTNEALPNEAKTAVPNEPNVAGETPSAVEPAECIGADDRKFDERVQSGQHPDLAALGVIPSHGHLSDPVAQPLRNKQHFNVESEPLEALPGKDAPGHIRTEELEPALRVRNGQADRDPHHRIEEFPGRLPKTRLTDADQGPVERT